MFRYARRPGILSTAWRGIGGLLQGWSGPDLTKNGYAAQAIVIIISNSSNIDSIMVCNSCMYVYIYIYIYTHMHTYTCICIYIYIYTYIHNYEYTTTHYDIYIYVCIYLYIYIYTHIHICICVCVCVYKYIYIYIYMYRSSGLWNSLAPRLCTLSCHVALYYVIVLCNTL